MEIIKFNKTRTTHTFPLNAERAWFVNIGDRKFACTPEHGGPGQYELEITAEHVDSSYESVLEVNDESGTYSLARLMYIPIALLPPNQPH